MKLDNFANTIFKRSYAFNDTETWEGCAKRVSSFVANGDLTLEQKFFDVISKRKFLPGGRYLAQAGKKIPQFNGCFLLKAEDTREGWGEHLNKHVCTLSTGGGVGSEYSQIRPEGTPLKNFGGVASGPVSLMRMVNEVAREVMAGGKRRAALWAGLAWWHEDIEKFIQIKNWPTAIMALKEQDFEYPAPLDMTNISVRLDDSFFNQIKSNDSVKDLYYRICKNMCKTGEPGFSIDIKKNKDEILRNPCQPATALLLTPNGLTNMASVSVGDTIWSGAEWTTVINKCSAGIKPVFRYYTTRGVFEGTSNHKIICNGRKIPVANANKIDASKGPKTVKEDLNPQDIMDGLVIGDGGIHKASNNLIGLYVGLKDYDYYTSRIKNLFIKNKKEINSLFWEVKTTITQKELPNTYNRTVPDRFFFAPFKKQKGFLRGLFSANGCFISMHTKKKSRISLKQSSRTLIVQVQLILSGLGIYSYITTNKPRTNTLKNGAYTLKESYDLNISDEQSIKIFMDTIGFIQKYKFAHYTSYAKANYITSKIIKTESIGIDEVFDIEVKAKAHTYWTGGLLVSNCCEITSDTTNDCCNLGSVNLARIKDLSELEEVTRIGIQFLYSGTFVSWLPHKDFEETRKKNRRIGLGLMGLHEWCLLHDEKYEPTGKLGKWLNTWQSVSDKAAKECALKMNSVPPIAKNAIAPTGTISIIAGTTSGIEPVFCVAYKRRFRDKDGKWKFFYVIDPTVERLVTEHGLNPNEIEDAFQLAKNVEKRISMQAFIQDFVDQGISSTINLPEWGEYGNNNAKKFSDMLLKYLPKLRGITVYPDSSRSGQPIVPIKYDLAKKKKDVLFEENEESCRGGICGL